MSPLLDQDITLRVDISVIFCKIQTVDVPPSGNALSRHQSECASGPDLGTRFSVLSHEVYGIWSSDVEHNYALCVTVRAAAVCSFTILTIETSLTSWKCVHQRVNPSGSHWDHRAFIQWTSHTSLTTACKWMDNNDDDKNVRSHQLFCPVCMQHITAVIDSPPLSLPLAHN